MRRINIAGLGMSALLVLSTCSLVGCVDEPKKAAPKAQSAAKTPKGLVIDAPPPDMKKLGTELDDKVTLLGYKLDVKKGPLKAGDKVTYTLYWKLNKPLSGKGWNLFTHVFDDGKKRLLNIDKVGELRKIKLGPDKWKVGKVYVDKQSFAIPKNVSGNTLRIVSGIWREKDTVSVTKGPKFRNGPLALTIPLSGVETEAAWVPPALRVDKLDKGTRIAVDGKLTEAAWATAVQTGAFVNVATGKADTSQPVQGSAKLLWDDRALYVAFEVKDKDIVGGFKKTEVDPHLWTKDTIELMIDPDGNGDNKDYYEIQVGPQNLVFDSQFDAYNQPKAGEAGPFGHQDWRSKLTSAVVVDGTLDKAGDEDKGYTVELSIPWTSFDKAKTKPPALGDAWRMNFYAIQANSGVAWSPILNKGNFHKASQFGRVLFAEKGWQPAVAAAPAGAVTSVTSALSAAPVATAAAKAPAPVGAAPSAAAVKAPAPSAPKPVAPAAAPVPVAPKPPVPAAPVVAPKPAPAP